VIQLGGKFAIATHWVGDSLASFQFAPFSKIRVLALSMALALCEFHAAGLGHNDIKLENILYGGRDTYVLCDLGAVHSLGEVAHEYSPSYCFENEPPVSSVRYDLLCLGATLYRLMLGCALPRNGWQHRLKMYLHSSGDLPEKQIIGACFEKDMTASKLVDLILKLPKTGQPIRTVANLYRIYRLSFLLNSTPFPSAICEIILDYYL